MPFLTHRTWKMRKGLPIRKSPVNAMREQRQTTWAKSRITPRPAGNLPLWTTQSGLTSPKSVWYKTVSNWPSLVIPGGFQKGGPKRPLTKFPSKACVLPIQNESSGEPWETTPVTLMPGFHYKRFWFISPGVVPSLSIF